MPFVYIIDAHGVLAGPVDLPEIPGLGIQVPANAVSLANQLPAPAAGKAWGWVGNKATQLPDNRGIVYSTATGASHDHRALGAIPAGYTGQSRPTPDHHWQDNAWVLDLTACASRFCNSIDAAADAARHKVAGDPLRAVEYDRARLAAEAFAAGDYQGPVPAMVAAWVTPERNAQQAADSILAEAAAYTNALELLRTTRLAAKEQVRTLMAADQVEQAQQLTEQTIASIEAAVAGIGNNA